MKKQFFLIFFVMLLTLIVNPIVHADVSNQTMNVSASVRPQPRDYQFSLALDDNHPTINNGQYYNFTITYGAKQSAVFNTANTVITFDWSKTLFPDNQYMFEYVYGSATDAYGGAQPIIDAEHLGLGTITWEIPNLPPGTTDQKLHLTLFTNTYDKTTLPIPFSLTATMDNQYVSLPDQILNENYQYIAPPPGPTATPGPLPTATPTPPPPPPPLYTVDIPSISPTGATVTINTEYPSKLSLSYGTSPTNLSHTISSTDAGYHTSLTLSNLLPDTQYYFQFRITSIWGYSKTSELYTFRTAKQALALLPLTGTAVISSNGSVLLSVVLNKNMSPGFALLPTGSPYDITVSLPQDTVYKTIEVLVEKQLSNTTVAMTQQQPGIYIAHMTSLIPGSYDILLKTIDDFGALTEFKLAQLRIISPLTVTDKDSGAAISNARIFLSYFDQNSHNYIPLQGLFGVTNNPGYTDSNGSYVLTLPPGKYRAQASALLYDPATVDFTLGNSDTETFPHIQLKKEPTNYIALLNNIKNYLMDILTSSLTAMQTIATSNRVFQIVATSTTGFLILVSYLLFLLKSHTTLKYLPLFFFFHLDVLLKKHKGRYLFGKVTDVKGMPLSLVRVEVEDADSKMIIHHTTTNKTGKFYFFNTFTDPVNLIIVKEGFQMSTRLLPTGFPEEGMTVVLKTGKPHHPSAFVLFTRGLREVLGMVFETALMLSVIFELLFFFFYGFTRTAPFLILSIINIILWLFYLRQRTASNY